MSTSAKNISFQELVEKGFLEPVKRGRPSLYSTDEERHEAHRAQQKQCIKRHAARVKDARLRLAESLKIGVCDAIPVVVAA